MTGMESMESQKTDFPPFPHSMEILRDYHIPTASTAGIFQDGRPSETESKAFGAQGGCNGGSRPKV
jgi:hypothetical protein